MLLLVTKYKASDGGLEVENNK